MISLEPFFQYLETLKLSIRQVALQYEWPIPFLYAILTDEQVPTGVISDMCELTDLPVEGIIVNCAKPPAIDLERRLGAPLDRQSFEKRLYQPAADAELAGETEKATSMRMLAGSMLERIDALNAISIEDLQGYHQGLHSLQQFRNPFIAIGITKDEIHFLYDVTPFFELCKDGNRILPEQLDSFIVSLETPDEAGECAPGRHDFYKSFKWSSQEVGELADKLARLYAAMALSGRIPPFSERIADSIASIKELLLENGIIWPS